MRKIRRVGELEDGDPLHGVANFFDLGIVFALGFLLALFAYLGLPELMRHEDMTLVKNPGTPEMEIIRKEGVKLERYRVTTQNLKGEGVRLGTAYRLKNGEVVYVPENELAGQNQQTGE